MAEPHTTIEIAVAVVAVAVIVEIPTRLTGKIWDVGGGMIQKTGLEVRLVVIARDRGAEGWMIALTIVLPSLDLAACEVAEVEVWGHRLVGEVTTMVEEGRPRDITMKEVPILEIGVDPHQHTMIVTALQKDEEVEELPWTWNEDPSMSMEETEREVVRRPATGGSLRRRRWTYLRGRGKWAVAAPGQGSCSGGEERLVRSQVEGVDAKCPVGLPLGQVVAALHQEQHQALAPARATPKLWLPRMPLVRRPKRRKRRY